jgi:miniconductance mechanosensitive channel
MRYAHFIYDYLIEAGLTANTAKYLNMLVLLGVLIVLNLIIHIVTRRIIISFSHKISAKSKTKFDDLLVANKAPRKVAHIIPLVLAIESAPIIFSDFIGWRNFVLKILYVFVLILILWILESIFNTMKDYLKTRERYKDKPIDSYIQVFMIFAWIIVILSSLAILTGIPFVHYISTLGAASAIVLLIFKDTILGFVASIQVSINDMIRIGDWVTFEKYGADGDVIEINLTTVKVQNFDKTITTIPTYALISDSFRNWRGMTSSGGRRIKRAVLIKQSSIKHLSQEEVEKLKEIELISDYLITRQNEIDKYNTSNDNNKNLLINGRNLTNVGVFRKYVYEYISKYPAINKDMEIMVRQLAPTPQGMPLEIYAFSSDKVWANYEYIMADIFDHVISSLPYFNLELFELPNNSNFEKNKA